mmetsp:Transcript_67020/g.212077  ORF Transcript_67020/g.212077 Transcript_67020/m.212077 type:complete len:223 (-) Transcript_67020:111-779(-)
MRPSGWRPAASLRKRKESAKLSGGMSPPMVPSLRSCAKALMLSSGSSAGTDLSCPSSSASAATGACPSACSSCKRRSKQSLRLPKSRRALSFNVCRLSSTSLELIWPSTRNSVGVTLPEKLRSRSPKMLASACLYPIFLAPSWKVLSVSSCLPLMSMASNAANNPSRLWPYCWKTNAWKSSRRWSADRAVRRLNTMKSSKPMASRLRGSREENTSCMSWGDL